MITKLTEDQEKLKTIVRDEWIKHFDSCTQIIDHDRVADNVRWVYSLAKLKPPHVLFVDSPWAAQLAANKAKSNVKLEFVPWGSYMDTSDFGWTSFYDYFQRIGVDLKCANWDRWREVMRSGIFMTIQLDGLCIVSRMPLFVKREPGRSRMHSVNGPAIRFRDGYELYSLWGVRFEKELYWKLIHKQISAKEVLQIQNMEQRMVALKFLGAENILSAFETTIADEKDGYKLISVKGMTDQEEFALRYACPSTGREYVSFVDPEIGKEKDAILAIASKWKKTKEEWLSIEAHS